MTTSSLPAYSSAILGKLDDEWKRIVSTLLLDCASPPNGEQALTPDEIDQAAYQVSKAIRDCAILDEWDKGSFFIDRLRKALSSDIAYAGIALGAVFFEDRRKSVSKGLSQEQEFAAKVLLSIREDIRDGATMQEALGNAGTFFASIAKSGIAEAFFSNSLPAVLKEIRCRPERFNRSVREWIRRAWIPLGLWMDVDSPQQVHDILERVRKCYPPVSRIPFDFEKHFLPAWYKVKPTRRRLPD